METALVPVQVGTIGAQAGIQTVNGRDLADGLEIRGDYTSWVKVQLESLQLVLEEDYTVFMESQENPMGGRPRKEVAFTLDAAKHIAMASRTEKGREVRAYFIRVEKEHRERLTTLSPAEQLMLTAQALMNIERGQIELRADVGSLRERVDVLDGQNGYMALAVYIKKNKYKYPGLETMKKMGARASAIMRDRGEDVFKIPNAQYGTINGYPEDVCAQVVAEFRLRLRGEQAA